MKNTLNLRTSPTSETAVRPLETETKLSAPVRKALMALIVGGIAAILDSAMVTLAIHTLVVRLYSTDGTIQWVTTGYLLAMAVAIPTTGWAEGRWGGKAGLDGGAGAVRARLAAVLRGVLERREPDRLPGPAGLRRRSDLHADPDARREGRGWASGQQPDRRCQPAGRARPNPRSGDRRADPELAELALGVSGQRA